jgi:hypothetical protein
MNHEEITVTISLSYQHAFVTVHNSMADGLVARISGKSSGDGRALSTSPSGVCHHSSDGTSCVSPMIVERIILNIIILYEVFHVCVLQLFVVADYREHNIW